MNWENIQRNPAYHGQQLPTHVVFPQCLSLLTTAPPKRVKPQRVGCLVEQWLRDPNFSLELQPYEGMSPGFAVFTRDGTDIGLTRSDRPNYKAVWTQEKIDVDPNSLYSTTSTPGKVKVNADNRGDGSPSSPFVTIVRRLDFEDGVPCGRAVVYFLRIEKVNGRYVPWRGPPLPPPPPVSPRLCLVNAALS